MESTVLVVDVVLVDLIGKDKELLLLRKLDDVLDVSFTEDLAGGVARVDDHYGADGSSLVPVIVYSSQKSDQSTSNMLAMSPHLASLMALSSSEISKLQLDSSCK